LFPLLFISSFPFFLITLNHGPVTLVTKRWLLTLIFDYSKIIYLYLNYWPNFNINIVHLPNELIIKAGHALLQNFFEYHWNEVPTFLSHWWITELVTEIIHINCNQCSLYLIDDHHRHQSCSYPFSLSFLLIQHVNVLFFDEISDAIYNLKSSDQQVRSVLSFLILSLSLSLSHSLTHSLTHFLSSLSSFLCSFLLPPFLLVWE